MLSASCGLGGSLLLIPTLTLLLGVKEGIVLSSILLGLNNVVKTFYYRHHIKLKASLFLLLPMIIGSAIGALLMVQLNSKLLGFFLLAHICISFFVQRFSTGSIQRATGIGYAGLAGLCSGLSGTSGPLKGIAVRCFHQSKTALVATASVISLASDAVKSGVYLSQLSGIQLNTFVIAFGLVSMPIASSLGKRINEQMTTKAYDALFYTVMSGYVLRLFI